MKYPKRPQYFALKYLRFLAEVSAATEIGDSGFMLLAKIALKEDELRYSRPVQFWNEQLATGFGSLSRMKRVRDKCVQTGWLHYDRGRRGKAAQYWVTIPLEFAGSIELVGHQWAQCEPQNEPESEPQIEPVTEPHSNLSYTLPNVVTDRPKTSRSRFSERDMQIAKGMFSKIRKIDPKAKTPDLEKWADVLRLMRERDGRTYDQIIEVYRWASNDDFWQANILSPQKLRKQFTKLLAGMQRSTPQQETPKINTEARQRRVAV